MEISLENKEGKKSMYARSLIPKEVPQILIYIWIFIMALAIGVIFGSDQNSNAKDNYNITLTNVNTQKATKFNNVSVSRINGSDTNIEITTKSGKHYYYPKTQFVIKTDKELR